MFINNGDRFGCIPLFNSPPPTHTHLWQVTRSSTYFCGQLFFIVEKRVPWIIKMLFRPGGNVILRTVHWQVLWRTPKWFFYCIVPKTCFWNIYFKEWETILNVTKYFYETKRALDEFTYNPLQQTKLCHQWKSSLLRQQLFQIMFFSPFQTYFYGVIFSS